MKRLLDYYRNCFAMVDFFHFNSQLTKLEYEKNLCGINGSVIPITNGCISDNRSPKNFSSEGLIVGFIGSDSPYKGLQVLIQSVKDQNIDVMAWGGKKMSLPFSHDSRIHFRGKFSKQQMPSIYNEMDILVVPSIWKETFSLVTLEALSFGIPVAVSDSVGAKDIVKEYDPSFVFHSGMELKCLLADLVDDKTRLIDYNKAILCNSWNHGIIDHASEIIENVYKSSL